jgi:hypothetical protein
MHQNENSAAWRLTALISFPITILLICGPVIRSFLISTNVIHAASNEDQWNRAKIEKSEHK